MKNYKANATIFDKIPSQSQLDGMVSDYVRSNNGMKPKFILMDEITMSGFCKIAHAKERIKTHPEEPKEGWKITHFWTTDGGVLELITVQRDPTFIQIVG